MFERPHQGGSNESDLFGNHIAGFLMRQLIFSFSETDRLDTGLIIEIWNKGMLWDKLLGLHWLPLKGVHISNQVLYHTTTSL